MLSESGKAKTRDLMAGNRGCRSVIVVSEYETNIEVKSIAGRPQDRTLVANGSKRQRMEFYGVVEAYVQRDYRC